MDITTAITQVLERATKPGLLGLVGKRVERRCKKDLQGYFRVLAERIEKEDFGKLYDVTTEQAYNAVEMSMDKVVRDLSPLLMHVLSVNLFEAISVADKQAVINESDKFYASPKPKQIFTDKVGLTGKEAAEYAQQRAAKLVGDINKVTRTRIAMTVSRGIMDLLGVDRLGKLIRTVVEDMGVARSELIASTEMNDAMSEATMRKLKRVGVGYKQLIASDDACSVCQSIEDAGAVPVDDAFVDEDGKEYQRTPIHPGCRCAVTGAPDPEEDN